MKIPFQINSFYPSLNKALSETNSSNLTQYCKVCIILIRVAKCVGKVVAKIRIPITKPIMDVYMRGFGSIHIHHIRLI